MTPNKKQKLLVKNLVKKWKPKLFLYNWDIELEFTNFDDDVAAHCSVNSRYFMVTIYIDLPFWRQSKTAKEGIIVHELCHCITEHSNNNCLDLYNHKVVTSSEIKFVNEQLTQMIANIAFPEGVA